MQSIPQTERLDPTPETRRGLGIWRGCREGGRESAVLEGPFLQLLLFLVQANTPTPGLGRP